MTNEMIKEMNDVTYHNEETGTWGFYGSDTHSYQTQKDAFDAYLETKNK